MRRITVVKVGAVQSCTVRESIRIVDCTINHLAHASIIVYGLCTLTNRLSSRRCTVTLTKHAVIRYRLRSLNSYAELTSIKHKMHRAVLVGGTTSHQK